MAQRYYLRPGSSISTDDAWYKINQEIGEGGNCVAYLVTQTDGNYKGNNFAIKIFKNTWDEERERRFQSEQEFLEDVTHPSILRYYDQGSYYGYPFLVAEYLPNTLREVIRKDEISFTQKLSYTVQLLSVLVHLENEEPPVVHRDIKPENIFVRGETCFLGDFGLMKRVQVGDQTDIPFYESDDVAMNRAQYRSPDLVKYERGEIDEVPVQSDVFQLGLVLTELFSKNNWNPQVKKDDPLSDVEMDSEVYEYIDIPEGMSRGIGPLIGEMLTLEYSDRKKASEIMDNWMGVYEDAAEKSVDIHGRVF